MAYIYALGGMVLWKAVSNTATWGTSGPKTLRAVSMPRMPAGLCRGASGLSSRRAAMTSSVMMQLDWNFSPPWTIRWPMASISPTFSMHLPEPVVIFLISSWNASVWVGKIAGVVALLPLASWVMVLLSMPMRSHRPLQSTFSPSISIS